MSGARERPAEPCRECTLPTTAARWDGLCDGCALEHYAAHFYRPIDVSSRARAVREAVERMTAPEAYELACDLNNVERLRQSPNSMYVSACRAALLRALGGDQ